MPPLLHPSLSPDTQVLDVRPILQGGSDPFAVIMQALEGLKEGQGLAIHAPFEPKPLFGVMASKGYTGRSMRLDENNWVTEFLPQPSAQPNATPAPAISGGAASVALHLDVRGLQPPEPMVQILAACENLGPAQSLEVTHDRRPQMLYPLLDERGLVHVTEEGAEGKIRIVVTRPRESARP